MKSTVFDSSTRRNSFFDNTNDNSVAHGNPLIEHDYLPFHQQVTSWFHQSNITYEDASIPQSPYQIYGIGKQNNGDTTTYKAGVHVIPHPSKTNVIEPYLCKNLTDNISSSPFEIVIHLHEDVWNRKNDIVKARLCAKINRVKYRWFARKTKLRRIDIKTTMDFLQEHHLWGATRSKFNYGLFDVNDDLAAVATFSPRRHVQRGTSSRPYRSHELIRYCAKKDGHVVGGITKLISGFCKEHAPDDLVTCIDRDWGSGDGWRSVGFETVGILPPLVMAISDEGGMRQYMVGAGIGCSKDKSDGGGQNNQRQSSSGRPGINPSIYNQLDDISNPNEAKSYLASNELYLVYDAGVERRMLLVNKNTKLDDHARYRREVLGLEDICHVDDDDDGSLDERDLWDKSTPSFPLEYYSANTGINALLREGSRSCK